MKKLFNKIISVLILFILISIHSKAFVDSSYITIESNIEGAEVFLDSSFIGTTPIKEYPIMPGVYSLKIFYPNEKSWNPSMYVDTFKLNENEHLKKFVELEYIFFINTNPSDAKIYYKDSLIGTTPLFFYTSISDPLLRLEKENYEPTLLQLTKGSYYNEVVMIKKFSSDKKEHYYKAPHLTSEVYVAGGSAILFGTAAALLKVKADEYYKSYRNTGDESNLSKMRKFDKLSGISLFLCELSNAILIYFLLLR